MGILNETIGGVPIGTLIIGMAIVLTIVWLWSRWEERKARKRATKGLKTKLQSKIIQGFERE